MRPQKLCFCDSIPSVDNQTQVVILQHRRERSHPFNTARIVRHGLKRCQLLANHTSLLAQHFEGVQLGPRAGLLYPSSDASLLTELPREAVPESLVILDGTWHHTKTMLRDIPRLRELPRYCLAPTAPGRYRIRREPNAQALSTLEATVAALQQIEPNTAGLDLLLDAFDRMIVDQLQNKQSNWRNNTFRRSDAPNIPRVLTGELDNIVVAYGEREQGSREACKRICTGRVMPVYWTAIRLVSGERFHCVIRSDSLCDPEFLEYLQLGPGARQTAVSLTQFRDAWKAFLRPTDRVAVHHRNTATLLENAAANFSPPLILKSVNITPDSPTLQALETATVPSNSPHPNSRASKRLASAVAFTQYLNARFSRSNRPTT